MVREKFEHKRILIFGASGTGKNWLGEKLSEKSGIKFYDTDDLAWIKRFTIKRNYDEKSEMLKKICKRDKWIIGTGATSYVGCAEKRANLIIILQAGFFRSTYRIIKRHIKNNRSGKEKSLHNPFKLAYSNYLSHRAKGKSNTHFEKLKLKYPNKVQFFSQREKHEFLKGF